MRLGQSPLSRPNDKFSMAVLALHLSKTANGVSARHGQVAREMWKDLWPETPTDQVPITSVTNGIHPQSWVSPDLADLLSRYAGARWIESPTDQSVWERVGEIPDKELWAVHEQRRAHLVDMVNERTKQRPHDRGGTGTSETTRTLDPHALTIGFARRFATYKRATLLFEDLERLARLLNQPGRPVQIIFAGKAHPRDDAGKEVLRQVIEFTRKEGLAGRVIFVENYDIALARALVQGADIWLNTPKQGLEASGTSGIKAAANGAVHLSTLDGWWCEGYAPQVGWCIDCGLSPEGTELTDALEAQALYDLFEKEIIPLFYERDSDGLPHSWIAKMKRCMREIMPFFNTHRMVQEYAESLYFPAAIRYERLKAKVF